jgi:hypothetical protein
MDVVGVSGILFNFALLPVSAGLLSEPESQ